ncbi:MAG: hypothetical protein SNJ83_13165 [Aggregatilineales bacterium]
MSSPLQPGMKSRSSHAARAGERQPALDEPVISAPVSESGDCCETRCAGALATQVRGAIPSLPYAAQLER